MSRDIREEGKKGRRGEVEKDRIRIGKEEEYA